MTRTIGSTADPVERDQCQRIHALLTRVVEQPMQFERCEFEVLCTLDEKDRRHQPGETGAVLAATGLPGRFDLVSDAFADATALSRCALAYPLQYEILLIHACLTGRVHTHAASGRRRPDKPHASDCLSSNYDRSTPSSLSNPVPMKSAFMTP
ncbi:MAG: hypothetical protein CMJ24_12490 [Phycisphaerae bacterium]|nr:hypothetical protein [Phycisphaerae bacterium]|tara:strand:+ start:2561 stop:3019 length:459 start_codon:yes stop_codon:yes gene_type:complete